MHKKKRKKKFFLFIILTILLIIICLLIARFIWLYSADTSWIEDFGYNDSEVYTLKLDKAGIPQFPVLIDEDTYYFDFDTGCSNDIVVTDVLKDKIDYSLLEQIEELNRDGSHRGWSNHISINSIQIFNQEYHDIRCSMIDWKMSSSYKFSGLLGTELFKKKLITLDYRARKIGISNTSQYNLINSEKYTIVPILYTNRKGQEDLIFFECKLNGENIIAYIDTGKNISYIHNSSSEYIVGESTGKPQTNTTNATIMIDNISFHFSHLYEVNMPQNYGFNYPIAIEINSDQFIRNDIVVTFDFINNYIIFYNR